MVKARLRDAVEFGVRELTVYSFSTENWSRPAEEVTALMRMFSQRIATETPELNDEGVRMRFIGRRERVTGGPARADGLGRGADRRQRPHHALRRLQLRRPRGGPRCGGPLQRRGEEAFRRLLYAPEMHDPDLIIRTSGEQRMSNYLLWQGAYSELVFSEELWPDFSREAFRAALDEFERRQRRFGGR